MDKEKQAKAVSYLLKLDQINNEYKEKIQNLAVEFIKERGDILKSGTEFISAGIKWRIEHAKVQVKVENLPVVMYKCKQVEGGVENWFSEEDIEV